MRRPTQEEYEARRKYIVGLKGDPKLFQTPWGDDVLYYVVDLGETAPFPMAAMAAILDEHQYVIAISDDVPERLRGFWALHELYDFAYEEEGLCCCDTDQLMVRKMCEFYNLSEADFKSMQVNAMREYLEARMQFYTDLKNFIQANPKGYDPEDPAMLDEAICYCKDFVA